MASTNLAFERGSRKNAPKTQVFEAFLLHSHHVMSEMDPRPPFSGPAFNCGMVRAIGLVQGMQNHALREGGFVFHSFASRAHSQMIFDELGVRSRTFFGAFVSRLKMRLSFRYTKVCYERHAKNYSDFQRDKAWRL